MGCNGNRARAFRERMSSAIGDKHQSTLTKMGAILGMGLIDAGGRNCRLDLCRSGDDGDPYGGPVRLTNVVGMALWLQHWHWYPMMHMVSLVLTPTVRPPSVEEEDEAGPPEPFLWTPPEHPENNLRTSTGDTGDMVTEEDTGDAKDKKSNNGTNDVDGSKDNQKNDDSEVGAGGDAVTGIGS